MNTYTVKNVKTFIGKQGHGYNASLYENGKRVAFVIEDASGSAVQYQWTDKEAEKRFYGSVVTNHDIFVEDMVNDFLDLRDMKRALKNKIHFVKPNDNAVYVINQKPTDDLYKQFKAHKNYQNCTILNELPESNAFNLWKKAAA